MRIPGRVLISLLVTCLLSPPTLQYRTLIDPSGALNPEPGALNPKPSSLNPAPQTPKYQTPKPHKPKPSTRNPLYRSPLRIPSAPSCLPSPALKP